MITAETHYIGTGRVFALMALGPVIAVVYLLYAFGYWMLRNGAPRWIIAPYAAFFAVVNTLHNWTVCTILFAEFPREFFTTTRLRRWKRSDHVGKRELADMMGGFLNRHDMNHY